jgi:tetratricopeptide (TPR) repeat protein
MHGSQPLEALLEIGKAFSDRREFHKALAAYQKAIEVDENDYRAYYLAAMVMRDGKDYPGAENMLRKAAQLNPDDVNIRRQLGAIVALNLVQTCQEANSCQ